MNIYKHLANSKVLVAVLSRLSDAFNRLAICAAILEIMIFLTSVSTNFSLLRKVQFQNFCNDTAVGGQRVDLLWWFFKILKNFKSQ